MKTILVPTDFSPQAENALDFAVQLARKSGQAEVKVVNIVEWPDDGSFNSTGEVSKGLTESQTLVTLLMQQNEKLLSDLVNREEYAGLTITASTEIGNIYKGIAKAIAESGADILVMGTKGTSGMDEVLVGSNTEKVIRHSNCPVLTLQDKVDFDKIKNIVFATDLKENQTSIVSNLKRIQELTEATIHILKVNTPGSFQVDKATKKQFDEFINEHKLTDYTTNIYNDVNEQDGVINFACEIPHSVIAIGTHGRTGIKHLLSGSIAEDLANHSTIPVWTMRMG